MPDPFIHWMIDSNLRRIAEGEDAETIVATICANGYPEVARAVRAALTDAASA